MKIDLKKDDIFLLIDSLYSYQLDIEHGNDNGFEYSWTEDQVMNLVDRLTTFVETKS
jgi:hypothetical protein